MRASELLDLYKEKYDGEKMCLVEKGVPDVIDNEGRHGWRMGGLQVHSSGKRVVVVVSHAPTPIVTLPRLSRSHWGFKQAADDDTRVRLTIY